MRRGPQDMPPGNTVTIGLGVVYVVASYLLLRLQGAHAGIALLHALVDVAILSAFTWLVLRHKGFRPRVEQTLSALLITGLVFSLLSAPSVHALSPFLKALAHGGQNVTPSGSVMLAYVLLMGIVFWSLAVMVNILRHALEVTILVAIGWTVVYQLSSLLIMSILFGRTG